MSYSLTRMALTALVCFGLLLPYVSGIASDPLAFQRGEKAAVLVFVARDCPVANALLPDVMKLQKEFEGQGVTFTLVHVDPDTTEKQAAAHAEAYHVTCRVVLDLRHILVKKLGATRTPEAFVMTLDGKVAYHGRINDLYYAPGQRRRNPLHEDLREALSAVVAGRQPPVPVAPSIGCAIEDFTR